MNIVMNTKKKKKKFSRHKLDFILFKSNWKKQESPVCWSHSGHTILACVVPWSDRFWGAT